MHKQKCIGYFLLAVALMTALAACGGEAATNTPAPSNTPAPTDTPAPTATIAPTVNPADLPLADLQATVAALEEQLELARSRAEGASSAGEESAAQQDIQRFQRQLATLTPLLESAGEPGADSTEESADSAAGLTLAGDFAEARAWTWDELQALEMLTAALAGPDENDPETEYTGVSFAALLEAAGLSATAETLVATASDGSAVEIDLTALKECADCMIVLADDQFNLVMPGLPSDNWVNAVTRLEAQ